MMKKLGFIGTGTITKAIVEGLNSESDFPGEIILSPRSEVIASELSARFKCTVAPDNQAVVDRSDIVFLAVRPQIAPEIVRSLRFRQDQEIVSFLAATSVETVSSWIAKPVRITQAIPLPFVADRRGATVVFPPNDAVAEIFEPLGAVIQVKEASSLNLFFAGSALMGFYFGILETASNWLQSGGLGKSDADTYLKQLFAGLANAMAAGAEFEVERHNHSTKGGLNEQLYRVFVDNGGDAALTMALTSVLTRLSIK